MTENILRRSQVFSTIFILNRLLTLKKSHQFSEHDTKIVPLENQDQQTANSQVVTPIPTSQFFPNYYNVLPVTWVHMYDYPAFYASGIDSVASTSASGTMHQSGLDC